MFQNNNCSNAYYTKTKCLQSLVCLLCFSLEKHFSGKFGPKTQNYQFKLKFCAQTNSNIQNSIVIITFSVFDWKYVFGQTWSKNSKWSVLVEISHQTNVNMQNYVENMWQKLFGTKANLNMPNSMMMVTQTNSDMKNSTVVSFFSVID